METLRGKRKARELKACRPCRQRKVKCDQNLPCNKCEERDHPDLCEYETTPGRPAKARRVDTEVRSSEETGNANAQNGASTAPHDVEKLYKALQLVSNELADLKRTVQESCRKYGDRGNGTDDSRSAGCNCHPPLSDSNSSEAFVHATQTQPSSLYSQLVILGERHGTSHISRDLFTKDALPFFGLDNASATYPFVDLLGLPQGSIDRTHELCKMFPNETDCWFSFKAYKVTAHALFPVLEDAEALEEELLQFLIARREVQRGDDKRRTAEPSVFGRGLGWLGLMFAILASGAQCSPLERSQRELTSKVYVCSSFECLRMTNFLASSDTMTIQTLLILGNVLCNNANIGVAWSLLGLTTRLYQTHESQQSTAASALTERLWDCIVWQDSLLSVTHGRAPSAIGRSSIVPNAGRRPRTYIECLTHLSKITMDMLRERSSQEYLHNPAASMARWHQEIRNITSNAADHLHDRRLACSKQERIENAGLHMLIFHVTSEFCRPALDATFDDCISTKSFRATCIESSKSTIEAFLLLQELTVFARRSWFAVYRALSCAILLATLRIPEQDASASELIERLIATLDSTQDPTEMSPSIEGLLQTMKLSLRTAE